jgi:hypothetical protein
MKTNSWWRAVAALWVAFLMSAGFGCLSVEQKAQVTIEGCQPSYSNALKVWGWQCGSYFIPDYEPPDAGEATDAGEVIDGGSPDAATTEGPCGHDGRRHGRDE